jgi:hypothetical protein
MYKDKDYDDLSEEELAAMRGDAIEDAEEDADEDADEDEVSTEEEVEDSSAEDSRFAALMEQVEASRERNAWLEDQLSKLIEQGSQKAPVIPDVPKVVYDYEAKEEEYINLIVEGEIAKATKLRSQIDATRTQELLAAIRGETDLSANKSIQEAKKLIEDERFSKSVEMLEDKYPFFNPNHKAYNAEAVDTVNSLMSGFIAKGESRSLALKKAVDRIVPFYDAKQADPKTIGSDRKNTAGKVAASAAKSQPPTTSGIKGGKAPASKPLSQYTDKEFAALSVAELKALRGDM